MKKLRFITVCIILTAVLLLCSGCSALIEQFEDEKTRGYTELVIDALIEEDIDTAHSVFSSFITKDDFAPSFFKMAEMIKNAEDYELRLLNVSKNTSYVNNGSITEIASVYEMTCESGKFIVDVKTNSTVEKLSSFYIAPYEETDYYYTGTIDSLKDAGPLQWVFLLSNVIIIGLSVFAIIDCAKNPVKIKALWIIIIIIGFITVGFRISSTNVNFNFNIGWFFIYSALIRYGGGGITVRFLMPIGTILYFILRRSLMKKPKPEPQPQPVYYQQNTVYGQSPAGYSNYGQQNYQAPPAVTYENTEPKRSESSDDSN